MSKLDCGWVLESDSHIGFPCSGDESSAIGFSSSPMSAIFSNCFCYLLLVILGSSVIGFGIIDYCLIDFNEL